MAAIPLNVRSEGDLRVLGFECPLCGKEAHVRLTPVQYVRWTDWYREGRNAPFLQDVFPDLPADDRETLISGTHDACFDGAFPDD